MKNSTRFAILAVFTAVLCVLNWGIAIKMFIEAGCVVTLAALKVSSLMLLAESPACVVMALWYDGWFNKMKNRRKSIEKDLA